MITFALLNKAQLLLGKVLLNPATITPTLMNYLEEYQRIRKQTMALFHPLKTEDTVVQPSDEVSPPKWHLGHTTWFYETMILKPNVSDYKEFNPDYGFLFNSYYESAGDRILRTNRGNLSRPTVAEIKEYRAYVDKNMAKYLSGNRNKEVAGILEVGLNHEQQHQELMLMDIKYILGHNPLFPIYSKNFKPSKERTNVRAGQEIITADIYKIGNKGTGFCYDNERERHKIYLDKYAVDTHPVSNGDFLKFIEAGGYQDFRFWHSEGWAWCNEAGIKEPMYWHKIDRQWYEYTLNGGLEILDLDRPVSHISYYEAAAFAAWKGKRLPTEGEWEVAARALDWGHVWEWTESAYLPYPNYRKPKGALGEYNAKFMVNQMVLKGASDATPEGHSRITYRNFFHAHERWQFSGLRLAETLND